MDADKLSEAADKELANTFSADVLEYVVAKNTFIKGANWLMTQPLTDRLTDEEKQRIRIMLDLTKLESLSTVQTAFQKGVAECLDAIFGKDLFNEK